MTTDWEFFVQEFRVGLKFLLYVGLPLMALVLIGFAISNRRDKQ